MRNAPYIKVYVDGRRTGGMTLPADASQAGRIIQSLFEQPGHVSLTIERFEDDHRLPEQNQRSSLTHK